MTGEKYLISKTKSWNSRGTLSHGSGINPWMVSTPHDSTWVRLPFPVLTILKIHRFIFGEIHYSEMVTLLQVSPEQRLTNVSYLQYGTNISAFSFESNSFPHEAGLDRILGEGRKQILPNKNTFFPHRNFTGNYLCKQNFPVYDTFRDSHWHIITLCCWRSPSHRVNVHLSMNILLYFLRQIPYKQLPIYQHMS